MFKKKVHQWRKPDLILKYFGGAIIYAEKPFFPMVDTSLSEIADADLSFCPSILSISQR